MPANISNAISAQMITRLLIISYFVAGSIGLIPGIDISVLAAPFLSETGALYAMRLLVLLLCGMVLFGIWRRPAALVLSIIVFWTSYLTLYVGGDVGAFWRDLALIGGLLLTANITAYADRALAEDFGDDDDYDDEDIDAGLESEPFFREDFQISRAG